jgi:hypothetical protein
MKSPGNGAWSSDGRYLALDGGLILVDVRTGKLHTVQDRESAKPVSEP